MNNDDVGCAFYNKLWEDLSVNSYLITIEEALSSPPTLRISSSTGAREIGSKDSSVIRNSGIDSELLNPRSENAFSHHLWIS